MTNRYPSIFLILTALCFSQVSFPTMNTSSAISDIGQLSKIYQFNVPSQGLPNSTLLTNDNGKTFYGHTEKMFYKIDAATHQLTELRSNTKNNYWHDISFSVDNRFIYAIEVEDSLAAIPKANLIKLSLDGKDKQTLREFSASNEQFIYGYNPSGQLIQTHDHRKLYGATESGGHTYDPKQGGVIYQLTFNGADNPQYKILHYFSYYDDGGSTPNGQMALSPDEHYLYGITRGANEYASFCGAVFRLSLDNTENPRYEVLYRSNCLTDRTKSFLSKLVISPDGNTLYAMTDSYVGYHGSVVKIALDKSGFPAAILHDFNNWRENWGNPADILLTKDGKALIGVSDGGYRFPRGPTYSPSVFKIDLISGEYKILYTVDNYDMSFDSIIINMEQNKLFGISKYDDDRDTAKLFEFQL